MRTIEIQSPSVWREAGGVIRAVLHIALWSSALMLASWSGGAATTLGKSVTAVDEVAFRELDGEAQRMFQRCNAGLVDAEDVRARTGAWPAVETEGARGVPPFAADPIDRAGYRWKLLTDGVLVNYVGVPQAGSTRPVLAIVVLEPTPGMTPDPLAIIDEQHHKLRDGTLLHVSIWTGGKDLTSAVSTPAFEDGWRRITMGDESPAKSTRPEPAVLATSALRVGVTLHPYYSWTANVLTGIPGAEVVPLLPSQLDADNFQPSPEDIARIGQLDAIVINGIGHDDFIRDMIKASGNTHLAVIEINKETPLVKSAHGDATNSHTFISFTNAIQETRYLAKRLGEVRPASAKVLDENAAKYTSRLRDLMADKARQLAHAKIRRVVTVHDGYTYLLQEFGIELAGVVQPAHGLTPSSKELGEMIDLIKQQHIQVVLTEESFPDKMLATLRDATGAKVYIISHIAAGTYAPDEFEAVMTKNADMLIQALVTDPK